MARSDPDKLAQALRANLRLRKERMRAAQGGEPAAPPVMSGADEEGDVEPPVAGQDDAAWVSVGSKQV